MFLKRNTPYALVCWVVMAESLVVLGHRRDATRVMYDILCLMRDRVSKTQIVYRANLNFHFANEYIRFLVEKRFIRKNDDGRPFTVYELTERGEHLIRLLEELYSPTLLSYTGRSSGVIGRAGRVS